MHKILSIDLYNLHASNLALYFLLISDVDRLEWYRLTAWKCIRTMKAQQRVSENDLYLAKENPGCVNIRKAICVTTRPRNRGGCGQSCTPHEQSGVLRLLYAEGGIQCPFCDPCFCISCNSYATER